MGERQSSGICNAKLVYSVFYLDMFRQVLPSSGCILRRLLSKITRCNLLFRSELRPQAQYPADSTYLLWPCREGQYPQLFLLSSF